MINGKQKRFTEEYVLDRNGAAAAVRAGYAPNSAKVTACRLLSRPDVLEAVRSHERAIETGLQMSRDKVIAGLLEAIDIAETKADARTLIAGWRELGKMMGYYEPSRKLVSIRADDRKAFAYFEKLSDQELIQMLELAREQCAE